MRTTLVRLCTALALAAASLTGCATDDAAQLTAAIGTACGPTLPCYPGLECEVEHGRGTCQLHRDDGGRSDAGRDDTRRADAGRDDASRADASQADAARDASSGAARGAPCVRDLDCGPGLECELEHGTSTCQPHGGDAGAPADAAPPPPTGAGAVGAPCMRDLDCGPGLECETEHGTSTCQPHGR